MVDGEQSDRIESIFISSEGSDQYHLIISLVRKLRGSVFESCTKKIVVGSFYNDVEELCGMAKADKSLTIYQNIENMAEVMNMCDLAISAGGTTVSELFACGVPVIAFSMADNQEGVKWFQKDDLLKLPTSKTA